MDNQDKLYQQFQNAAQNAPEKDFPAMEKIWGRVEEKLDKKALKKENNLWKKIAVAASVLLVITLGSQFLKDSDSDKTITRPETEIVTAKNISPEKSDSEVETEIVSIEKQNPLLKENASEIVKSEANKPQNYAVNDVVPDLITNDSVYGNSKKKENRGSESVTTNSGYFRKRPAYEAVGVEKIEREFGFVAKSANTEETIVQKQSPLYIINGKAVKNMRKQSMRLLLKKRLGM